MKENAEKLRALGAEELDQKVRDAAEQMFRIKFQMSMGQTDGMKKYRVLRKERARLLTIRTQRGVTGPVLMAAPKAVAAPVAKAKKPRAKKA